MNLNNLLHREILPALNRCKHCLKAREKHAKADHGFVRDESIPQPARLARGTEGTRQ